MRTIPILLGAAALLLLRPKRPSAAALSSATVMAVSAQAIELARAQDQADAEKSMQIALLRKTIVDEQTVVGAPPYLLSDSKRYPTPFEVAVLYSVDPTLVITERGVGSVPIADLFQLAVLEDPTMGPIGMETDKSKVINNAISILSPAQQKTFVIDLASDALGRYGLLLKDSRPYFAALSELRKAHLGIVSLESIQPMMKQISPSNVLGDVLREVNDTLAIGTTVRTRYGSQTPIDAVHTILQHGEFKARQLALSRSKWYRLVGPTGPLAKFVRTYEWAPAFLRSNLAKANHSARAFAKSSMDAASDRELDALHDRTKKAIKDAL